MIAVMDRLQRISNEITRLTGVIGAEYPELYRFLDENPMTIPAEKHPEVGEAVLMNYLESLRELLRHHSETHHTSATKQKR